MAVVAFDTRGTNTYESSSRASSSDIAQVADGSLSELLGLEFLSAVLQDRPPVPELLFLSYPTDSRIALTEAYLREQLGPRPSPILSSAANTTRGITELAGSFSLSA